MVRETKKKVHPYLCVLSIMFIQNESGVIYTGGGKRNVNYPYKENERVRRGSSKVDV